MGRKVYIVPPVETHVRRALRAGQGYFGAWLYVGERVCSLEACERWLKGRGRQLRLGEDLQAVATATRQTFIDYVGVLGTRLESPQWWLSSLAEKNPYVSKVFLRLCHVLTIVRLVEREPAALPVLIVVEELCVRRALADYLNTRGWTAVEIKEGLHVSISVTLRRWLATAARWAWFLVNHGSRLVQARLLGAHRPEVWGGDGTVLGRGLVLLHGWVDRRSFDGDGRYRNVNLGGLGPYLKQHGWASCLVPLVISTVSYRVAVEALRRSGARFLLPHAWLTPFDLVLAVLTDLRWQRPRGPFPRCAGVDIEPLIAEDLRRDRELARVATNWLYVATVKRWRRSGVPVAGFVYSYENHLWERAFCLGFRLAYPQARLIGYQDANVPEHCLNFFNAVCEWSRLPIPDLVVTNGPYSADRLRQSGYPETFLRCGGAVRFASSMAIVERNGDRARRAWEGSRLPPVVLVVPPVSVELASELVRKTVKALGREFGVRVVVKCHPVLPFPPIAAALGGLTLPPHFQVSDRPFLNLLGESGVLLYMDSTTCLEALAHGVPVIHVGSDWSLDLDTIGEECQERLRARSPEEIVLGVRWVLGLQGAELEERRRRGRLLITRFFGPADGAAYRPVAEALACLTRQAPKPGTVMPCRS